MIMDSYSRGPRDVHTIPLQGNKIWFYVCAENGELYISKARHHANSSQVRGQRRMDKQNCEAMLALYRRRKQGESVSMEASATTQNQVYWYGIFDDMDL